MIPVLPTTRESHYLRSMLVSGGHCGEMCRVSLYAWCPSVCVCVCVGYIVGPAFVSREISKRPTQLLHVHPLTRFLHTNCLINLQYIIYLGRIMFAAPGCDRSVGRFFWVKKLQCLYYYVLYCYSATL